MLSIEKHPFLAAFMFGLAHALLFGAAFPPLSLWPLAVVSAAPLISIALRSPRPARSALAAGLASIPMWGFHHQFIAAMTEAGVFPLVVYLGLYPGLFVWMLARITRAMPRLPLLFTAPTVWVGLEVLRGEVVWNGYPSFLIAHPLAPLGAVSGYASIIGTYGVSFLLMLALGWAFDLRAWARGDVGCGMSDVGCGKDEQGRGSNDLHPTSDIRHPTSKSRGNMLRLAGLTMALGLLLGTPWMRSAKPTGRSIRIAAVQMNLAQDNKMDWPIEQKLEDFAVFADLTRLAAAGLDGKRADLIVWPETMFPGIALNPEAVQAERDAGLSIRGTPTTVFYTALMELSREVGIPMVVGARAVDGQKFEVTPEGLVREAESAQSFNSAFLIVDGAVSPVRYDKMHLTPFGEVMPYISAWPWLEAQLLALGATGMTFELSAGAAPRTLDAPVRERVVRIAAPICFEATMPEIVRDLVVARGERRADVIINLSNNGWYAWFDGGRACHLLMARWRAIELGTPLVLAANTGISAVVDARGRVIVHGPNLGTGAGGNAARAAGVMVADVSLPEGNMTIFSRTGNVVGWGALAAMGLLIATALWPEKRRGAENGTLEMGA